MDLYHSTDTDPPSLDMTTAQQTLAARIAQFLADGGNIEVVGAQMRDGPDPFVINAKTAHEQYDLLSGKIAAQAALGHTPAQVARALDIPIKRCLVIAEQRNVQWGRP